MELTLNENFCEMSNNEMIEAEGGVAPAIIYAAGFGYGHVTSGCFSGYWGRCCCGCSITSRFQ